MYYIRELDDHCFTNVSFAYNRVVINVAGMLPPSYDVWVSPTAGVYLMPSYLRNTIYTYIYKYIYIRI